jgi:hypothetical protein
VNNESNQKNLLVPMGGTVTVTSKGTKEQEENYLRHK